MLFLRIARLSSCNSSRRFIHISGIFRHVTPPRNPGGGPNLKSFMPAKAIPPRRGIPNVNRVVAVSSAKGGVGKSTVAVNLAMSLALQPTRPRVGILDLDIFGPSIPKLMGLEDIEDISISPGHATRLACQGDPVSPGTFRGSVLATVPVVITSKCARSPLEAGISLVRVHGLHRARIGRPPGRLR